MTDMRQIKDAAGESSPRFPVLSIGINAVTLSQTVLIIDSWIRRKEKHYINVCTVHTALECYDSPDLAGVVNRSGLSVPDGMPLVWLGKLRRLRMGRVYGPDLMLSVCQYGQTRGYRHFFYGSTPDVISKLENNLSKSFPDIRIAGRYSPPFTALSGREKQDVAAIVNHSQADIVWVGLGTPKQDHWVGEFRSRLNAPVLIAVGAAFDFHAGTLKQAPRWMMSCGLEWFFRLVMEPKRLWKRYIFGNPIFIFLTARQLAREALRSSETRRSHNVRP